MTADTTTDLAAAIRAKSKHWRWRMPEYAHFSDLTDAILARHYADEDTDIHDAPLCHTCGFRAGWPCPDVRDLATAWSIDLRNRMDEETH